MFSLAQGRLIALIATVATATVILLAAASASAQPTVEVQPKFARTNFYVPHESGPIYAGSEAKIEDCPPGPLEPVDPEQPFVGPFFEDNSCPWSVTVEQAGKVVWERAYSGEGKLEKAVGPKTEFEEFEPSVYDETSYPWSCEQTGALRWIVEVRDDLGSGWKERSAGTFTVPGCLPVRPTFETLAKAQAVVVQKLRPEYVSRLRCSRRGFAWHCGAVYNSSFRECRANFRVVFYSGYEFGERVRYHEVRGTRRHCVSF